MGKVNFYCGKVDSQGGSKISLLNLIFLFKQEKKEYEIFVSKKGWFTEKLELKEINYTVISEPNLIKKITKNTNPFLKVFLLLICLPKLVQNWIKINNKINDNDGIIINENRDLLLFFPIVIRRKVNIFQWIRAEYPDRVAKLLMKRSNKVIVVSDIVKANINSKTRKSIYRIHNFTCSKPQKVSKKLIDDNIVNIAVVGSIQKIKGQLDAVKLLNYIQSDKEVQLHIIGREYDEAYTKQVKKYVHQNDLTKKVKFLGNLDDVTGYMNKYIHFTLIPSQTESFCRVAIESLSVGVPVIAYKVGGLKEVILDGKTGILIEKDNIRQMSAAVDEVIRNKEMYTNMSDYGIRDWEKRFYSESIKNNLFEVLS